MTTLLTLLLSFGAMAAHAAEAFQIRTDQTDVNLWSGAGRAHARTMGPIKAGENLTVLKQITLANGQTWYRVRAEGRSGYRPVATTAWVHSKFFRRIHGGPGETDAGFCIGCSAREKARRAGQLRKLTPVPSAKVSPSGFRWPVGGVLRSRFGWRRHPFTGLRKFHEGIDISGNRGHSVAAAKAGRVVHSNSNCREGRTNCGGRAGNMVVIDHGDGTQTQYMHLSQSCRLPPKDARVAQGTIIGCVGSTGRSTGAHLHFGVIVKNKFVDPLSVLPRR